MKTAAEILNKWCPKLDRITRKDVLMAMKEFGNELTVNAEQLNNPLLSEEELMKQKALSKEVAVYPTEYDKGFILGWRLCWEWMFSK